MTLAIQLIYVEVEVMGIKYFIQPIDDLGLRLEFGAHTYELDMENSEGQIRLTMMVVADKLTC